MVQGGALHAHILRSAPIKVTEADGKEHIQGKQSRLFACRMHAANAHKEHKKILSEEGSTEDKKLTVTGKV